MGAQKLLSPLEFIAEENSLIALKLQKITAQTVPKRLPTQLLEAKLG